MDVTLLFELVAWSGNTEKRLPTISFMMFSVFVLGLLLQITLILCHDSEAAKCLSNSVAIDLLYPSVVRTAVHFIQIQEFT